MLKYLRVITSAMGYIYTAVKLVIYCIKMRRITLINDKLKADREIAEAVKAGDTKKIAQLINFYRDGYDDRKG